jgi:hypothetical protein
VVGKIYRGEVGPGDEGATCARQYGGKQEACPQRAAVAGGEEDATGGAQGEEQEEDSGARVQPFRVASEEDQTQSTAANECHSQIE